MAKTNRIRRINGQIVNPPFHQRYRTLLLIAAFGGLYHPSLGKIYPSLAIQWALWTFTTITSIFLASFPVLNLIHFLFMANTLNDYIMDLMIISSGLHAFARMGWFYMRKTKFYEMYELWDEYFGADRDAIDRENNILVHYNKLKKKMYYLTVCGCLALNPWMLSQYFLSDKIMKVPTPLSYRHQSPDFEIMVTCYAYPCIIHSFATSTIHILMLLPIIWIQGELEHLKRSLRSILELGEGKNMKTPSDEIINEIDQRLSDWVAQHQKLILFYEKVKVLVWVPYSIEMLATFMAAWLTSFNLVQDTVGIEDKITEIFFYVPYVLMFILTCFYCDHVTNEGQCIIDEAYITNWSALPLKFRSSLVIIASITKRTFVIKGFKLFPTGYNTFAQIMQSAYTMFNFLLAAIRKEDDQ